MTAILAHRWVPIVIALVAAAVVAGLGASMTDLGPWYQELRQPSWKPPDALFGPAWTLIFGFTALSAAKAWVSAPHQIVRTWIVGLFCLNGILNILWSWLFFRIKRPDWAMVEVFLLWLSILMLFIMLARFSKPASWLLAPYLVWVAFAAVLNFAVVRLNGPFGGV